MKLKKLLYVVPFVAAGIALAACSGGGDNPGGSTSTPPTSQSSKGESSTPAPSSSSEDYSGTHTYKNLKYQFNNDAEHTINITNCDSLEEGVFEVPDTIEYNGKNYKVKNVAVTFYSNNTLTTVKLGQYVESLNPGFAEGCGNLASVTLSASLKSIPEGAFKYCEKLESITLPDGLLSIGKEAFRSTNLKSLVLPSTVKTLGIDAFSYNEELATVTLSADLEAIPERAFFNCNALGAIDIPSKVTSIGKEAFYACYQLSSVTIGEAVTNIGKEAFNNCHTLGFIDIPDSVTSMGEGVFRFSGLMKAVIGKGMTSITNQFSDATNLVTVVLGENVASIGEDTFNSSNNSNLKEIVVLSDLDLSEYSASRSGVNILHKASDSKYVFKDNYVSYERDDEVIIYKYYGNEKDVVIPSEYTRIGPKAFSGSSLESVTIPESIEYIDDGAFKSCRKLKTVNIPESVKSIYSAVFSNCTALESIVIPDGVEYLGGDAFYECSALTSVKLSKNITAINNGVFHNCTALESIVIPDGVGVIGNEAFAGCTALTSITIPESVVEISYNPFDGCSSLETVNFPDSLISFTPQLMRGCDSFEYTEYQNGKYIGDANNPYKYLVDTVKNDVTSFKVHQSTISIAEGALGELEDLAHLEIPFVGITKSDKGSNSEYSNDYFLGRMFGSYGYGSSKYYSVTAAYRNYYVPLSLTELVVTNADIQRSALGGCKSLQEVTLEKENLSIGDYAFAACEGLTTIELPNSLLAVGADVFQNCPNIQYTESGNCRYLGSSDNDYLCLLKCTDKNVTTIDVNPLTAVIAAKAFYMCEQLQTVTLNSGLAGIGNSAFYYCPKLNSVTLPATLKQIGNQAFASCGSLTSITIPSGVKVISYGAFSNCSKLQSVSLPNTVTKIDDYAFSDDILLQTINFPTSLTYIGANAFSHCNMISSIYLSDDITHIGDYAFYYTDLSSVSLSAKTVDIGDSAFLPRNASTYTVITIRGVEDAYEYLNSFTDRSHTFSYREKTSFTLLDTESHAITEVKLPENLTSIKNGLLMGLNGITTVNIPAGLTSIGEYAFANCNHLSSIVIPNTVTNIGEGAFRDMNLSVYNFDGAGSYIKTEDNDYFALVYLQHDDEINENTVIIGGNVNQSNHTLVDVVVPDSVLYISDGAFRSSNSMYTELQSVQLGKNVKYIGKNAFSVDTKLRVITIPKSVEYIGEDAFSDCFYVEAFYEGSAEDWAKIDVGEHDRPFENDWRLHLDSYPTFTYVSDENYSYYEDENHNVYNLASNKLSSIVSVDLTADFTGKQVISIAHNGFYSASALQTIVLPNTLKYIGSHAFEEDALIDSIVLPDSVEVVGIQAFRECNLSSVTLSKNLRYIGQGAFQNNDDLEVIELPEGLEFIGTYAFLGCDKITEVTIPSTVKEVEYDAFESIVFARIMGATEFDGYIFGDNLTTLVMSPDAVLNDYTFSPVSSLDKLYWLGEKSVATAASKNWDNKGIHIFENTEAANTFYFTSNGAGETAQGNWWYFDTDGKTIIEKVVS